MASIGGSIRTILVNAGITGVTGIFRDFAPPSTEKPYITYSDELRNVPELIGDGFVKTRRRMVQFDLWQNRQNEDTSLVDSLVSVLDGAGQFDDGTYVFRLRVSDIQRMVSLEDNVVHHALTLDVFQKA
jgi:hypothetical protein